MEKKKNSIQLVHEPWDMEQPLQVAGRNSYCLHMRSNPTTQTVWREYTLQFNKSRIFRKLGSSLHFRPDTPSFQCTLYTSDEIYKTSERIILPQSTRAKKKAQAFRVKISKTALLNLRVDHCRTCARSGQNKNMISSSPHKETRDVANG